MIYVVSVSGGKDSAALAAWMKRTGVGPRRLVACDTKWEANFDGARWIDYIRALELALGEPIEVVTAETGFADRVVKHSTFPGKMNRRWCTEELKLHPFRDAVDRIREETGDVVEVVLGIRADESDERAKMPEREWSDLYDCWVWRPMLAWTVEDVLHEHHASGIPINPLYRLGADRVGCWPCIKAGKLELRLIADLNPERIDEIEVLEQTTDTTMYCLEASTAGGAERKMVPTPIREMIAWARTSRGGRNMTMFREPGGCARWGLCDLPKADPNAG